MMDETMIAKAKEVLQQAARPKKIILFGSHARGNAGDESDLDFLVIEDHVDDRVEEMVRLTRMLSPLRIPVEVLVVSEDVFQDWSKTPGNVYYEAATEGKILYEEP